MTERRPRPHPRRRRGFGLIEMAISGMMIAAAMAVTIQVVGWVAAERRAVARRERAVVEVANLMERVAGRPFDEITPESLAALRLPDAARAALPGAEIKANLDARNEPIARKRITLELRWADRAGRAEAPVRLVAWSHREGGAAR